MTDTGKVIPLSPEVRQAYDGIAKIMPYGNLAKVRDILESLEIQLVDKWFLGACPKCGEELDRYVPLSKKVLERIEAMQCK